MERPSRRDHIQCLVLQNQRTRDEYLASAPAIIPVAQQENIVPPPTMEQVQEQLANIPIPPIYHPITTPKPKHIPKNDSISLEKKQKLVQIYNRDLINGVRRNKQYYLELSSRLTIKVNSIKYLLSKIKEGNHFEVEKQKGRKPLVTTEHLKTVGEFVINENGSIKRSPQLLFAKFGVHISRSTIQRAIHNPIICRSIRITEGKSFSFNRLQGQFPPEAESIENRQLRVKVMKQLYLNVRSGLLQVNIDETHWKLGNLRKYGYMARGTQRQQLLKDPSLPVTAITAITGDGHKYCKVYIGTTIDSSLFNVFLSELIQHLLVNQCGRCVFFLDNCSIHKVGAERIIKAANHVCLFNAPYSPQMNGIEYTTQFYFNKSFLQLCVMIKSRRMKHPVNHDSSRQPEFQYSSVVIPASIQRFLELKYLNQRRLVSIAFKFCH
ncbi:Conserved_hypothetical protein [Hexamita inflata]|uniref:Tc1-like transposase DDE domain-containing protein n=1 Tax=Hexamita inflata TaxID=28002 RepID=A0AA86U9Z7_9EUKA|nr:Conserved hypothetical protein [Hexamita inflata]